MTDTVSSSKSSETINQELVEREAELMLINSVQQALASRLDVQSIYNLVGDKIRDIFDSQIVMISTYDPVTETIEHRYAIERGEHIYAPGRYPIRGFRTQIVQTRQPVMVNKNVAELAKRLGQHTIPGTITPKSWLGVPMIVGEQVTGILSLQNIDREYAFDEGDVRLLQTLASSMSVALENARLFDETQRLLDETKQRAIELHIINRIQEELAQKLEQTAIFELVGDKLSDFFKPANLSIIEYDYDTDLLSTPYQVENGRRTKANPYHVEGKGFFAQLLKNPQPLLIDENMEEAVIKYQNVYSSATELPRSALFMPLITGGGVHGAIVLKDMKDEHAFDETEIHLLQTLANAMSVALENARLWEQEALYRKALEREFEIGHEIQAGFLPETIPQPAGWEIAASLKSAREVTGDFYDVFELPDGQIGLVIADVCDKGLGAALFMTLFRSLIRAVANIDFFSGTESGSASSPGRRIENAMAFTNNYIAETHGRASMFCTIFFGVLDTSSGVLTYVNGGHLPPLVINTAGVKAVLKASGPAVGVAPGASYQVCEVTIDLGDVMFAHTDGLTDTINPAGEYFDKQLLIPLLTGGQDLTEVLNLIQSQVKDYSTGATQVDDITMLALRRNSK